MIVERTKLVLSAKGLTGTYHIFKNKKTKLKIIDHSEEMIKFLFERVSVTNDFTLGHFIDLAKKNPNLSSVFSGEYFQEWIDYILSHPQEPDSSKDYIEIFWDVVETSHYLNNRKYLEGIDRPAAYVRGLEKGKKELYCLLGLSLSKYLHLPIKLNREFQIQSDKISDYPEFRKKEHIVYEYERDFTLGQILTAIFKEIAFHGPPEKAEEFDATLKKRVEDLKTGRVKGIPWKELRERIRKNYE